MGLELQRRLRNLFGAGRKRYFGDDFNWETYTRDKYGPQLERMARTRTLRVGADVRFDEASGTLDCGTARLHPNFRAVYELVGLLKPASVLEIGCGGGDHLANLRSIYPGIKLSGVDRSEGQLALLAQRNPDIAPLVSVRDMTMPWSSQWEVSDLVYSQAVIMHINTAVSHLVALSNMFRLARNHVVLMENYACHPFHEDVMRLFNGGQLGWSQIHAYAHRVDGQPYCLVYSREPQALPPLTDYMLLPGASEPKYK
jgi:SAM-dependent methyltransferase